MDKYQLQITGYSDDIISLDGSICDEFSPSSNDDTAIIRLPDGSRIKFFYDDDGIWRGEILENKTASHGIYQIHIQKGEIELDTNDLVFVNYPIPYITWSCKDGRKGAIGEIPLTDSQEKTFKVLKDLLEDADSFAEVENLVRAILAEIEF